MSNQLQKLGLGTWAIGGKAYGPLDDNTARAIVHRAVEIGIPFFDTAHIYGTGKSEEILGECLPAHAHICTKLGYDLSSGKAVKNYSNEFLDRSLEVSLARLKRSKLDLLLLHNPPTDVLRDKSVYQWLNSKIADGKISRWGCSVYDSIEDATLALNAGASAIEARYSLLRRDIIDELPQGKWNFEFIARSPLDGGILSGKYWGHESFPSTDQRSAMKKDYFQINQDYLKELQPLKEDGTVESFAELAIRFVAFHPQVTRLIPGAKSVEQLEQNARAVLKGPLPAYAVAHVNQLQKTYLPKLFL